VCKSLTSQGHEQLFTCHLYLCAQHWAYTIVFFSFENFVVTPLGASQEWFNNKWQPFLQTCKKILIIFYSLIPIGIEI
jgi:hypothetical protein